MVCKLFGVCGKVGNYGEDNSLVVGRLHDIVKILDDTVGGVKKVDRRHRYPGWGHSRCGDGNCGDRQWQIN